MAMAEAFRSSTSRPVGLRYRGDLVTNRQVYQGQAWYVVKDPIGLSYYRFRPEEYALLEMLDGEASLEDLKDDFEARFPPRRITVDEVSRFVSTLHRSGLVIGDRPGQGPQLNERRRQRVWSEWKNWLRSIMFCGFVVSTQTGFSTSSILGLAGCTHRRHSWLLLCTYSQHSC